MADDNRPRLAGHVPASGAPLNARTLALRPGGQSIIQGDTTSSDMVADAVYRFLQSHPGLGVPEQGQQNLAEENPSRLVQAFFYTHPPIKDRLRAAQDWAATAT